MTNKNMICYKRYKEIRREWWFFVIVMLLFIPLTLFSALYIKPRIEKVFIVKFSQTFAINEFMISALNRTDMINYDISQTEANYSTQYFIDKISFAFQSWDTQYTSNEYLNAIIYKNYSTDDLLNNIERGNYVIREFDIDNQTFDMLKTILIRFKIPHVYQLFYINIHIKSFIDENCSGQAMFYQFFNTVKDQRVSQTNILINTLLFYNNYYNNPIQSFYSHIIMVAMDIDYDSSLSFDLSFR